MKFSVEHINVTLGNKEILHDISFSVEDSTIVGILGPNGSGKTTLLRSIINIIRSEGNIVLDRTLIKKLSKSQIAQKISFLPQSTELFKGFKSFDVVLAARYPYNSNFFFETKDDIEKATWAMDVTGAIKYKERYLSELSSGERGIVLISRSLAQDGSVLLLDEPTAHLDVKNQVEILKKIREIVNTNRVIAIITFHDVSLCKRFSDKVLILKDGRVAVFGLPNDVITDRNIEKVFGVDLNFNLQSTAKLNIDSVHIICGAGSGSEVARWFVRNSVKVTMGILSPMDQDYITARDLGIGCLVEEPFKKISDEIKKKHVEMISLAPHIIVTEFPVGYGNLANIEVLTHIDKEKEIWIIENGDAKSRDFTNGHFEKLWNLIRKRSKIFNNTEMFYTFIQSKFG